MKFFNKNSSDGNTEGSLIKKTFGRYAHTYRKRENVVFGDDPVTTDSKEEALEFTLRQHANSFRF